MVKNDDPVFVAQFGAKKGISVGKIGRLVNLYARIVSGFVSLSKIDAKDRTQILLAALRYNIPVTLHLIALDVSPVDEPAAQSLLSSSRLPVINTLRALEEIYQYFLDNTTLIGNLAKYHHGVDICCNDVVIKVFDNTNLLIYVADVTVSLPSRKYLNSKRCSIVLKTLSNERSAHRDSNSIFKFSSSQKLRELC